MAFSSRDTARAASIYEMMLRDTDCGVILCLAGSLNLGWPPERSSLISSATTWSMPSSRPAPHRRPGLLRGPRLQPLHRRDEYKYGHADNTLRELMIDRIYDTFIDEEELRFCDETTHQITNSLEPRPYSSREFIARWAPTS